MMWKSIDWKSPNVQRAVLAGVGLTSLGVGCYIFYKYKKRSPVLNLDEATITSWKSNGEQQKLRKERLKQLLRAPNVHMKDIDYVEETIDNLIVSGPSQLQLVADFDRTMTPVIAHNNKPVPSCHGVLENLPGLPTWFHDRATKTRDYYMAIEFDPNMTREEKYPFMVEWWTKAHELLVSSSLRREQVVEAVNHANLLLRTGSSRLLDTLHSHDVPLLIFSAGVGDIIEEVLKQRYALYSNIKIIANWMDFNHNGSLVGFKGDIVHVFNKNTHAIEHSHYFDDIKHRHSIVLLGDSLGDLDISQGINVQENLLTIGFLNTHVEASLPEYKRHYDIVLTGDPSFELLNSLLDNIVL